MELRQYASILWRWAWLLVLGTALAAASALVAGRLTQPVYRATATLLIDEAPASQMSDYTALLTSERLARTYVELLTKRSVLDAVIAGLALEMDSGDLAEAVSVSVVRDTRLIELSVEDTDPARAALLANSIPVVFGEQNEALQASRYSESKQSLAAQLDDLNQLIVETQAKIDAVGTTVAPQQEADLNRLQSELTQYRQSYTGLLQSYEEIRLAQAQTSSNVLVVEPASPPGAPVRPNLLQNTALAAVVGLMLAVGVVFLIEYLDDSIKSPDQITQHLALPVLGTVARLSPDRVKAGPVTLAEPLSPVTEGYRALRTNIQFYSVDRPLRAVLITSPGPAEGKSMISANLAIVVAQAGYRVILLDADLRRPSQHTLFAKANGFGLTDALLRATPGRWESAPQPFSALSNLSVVTSGALPPNPAELLGSETMTRFLDHLRETCDLLVIDTPPLGAVTDAAVLAAKADGVLMVIDAGATRIGAAEHAREQLQRVGANLFGVVMNKVTPSMAGGAYYHYYHHYYHPEGASLSKNGRHGHSAPRRSAEPPFTETPAA